MVQSCLSQEGQNVLHFYVLKQITQIIHLKKSLSDESKSSTFYENVFNGARHLTCQTLWLLFLLQYERVSKPCITNVQLGYYDLFSSWFSESWFPFSQNGLDLEEFIVDVIIPALLPYLKNKSTRVQQLLQVVTHTEWGADRQMLLNLYRSLSYSKLNYAIFINRSARRSYLK